MSILDAVSALYEARPYPPVGRFRSLLQGIRRDNLPLLAYETGYKAAYGDLAGAAERPRILVAGCGTFEPLVVALANPEAEILAVDLSARSLKELNWQLRWRGLKGRVQTLQGDIEKVSGKFDYVIATGVIHHLEDPQRGLEKLVSLTGDRAIFRFMIYSRWGRDLLYQTKALAQKLGATDPRSFRRMIDRLPENHPYRIYFHLYSDARTDAGLADGYLHPCDRAFTALELEGLLNLCGLRATKFLHREEGQPMAALRLTPHAEILGKWQKLALLEAYGQLEENFLFFAAKEATNA
jgi:SAM-dependent methyltransferase